MSRGTKVHTGVARHGVDELVHHADEERLQAVEGFGGERLLDKGAMPPVLLPVHLEDGPAHHATHLGLGAPRERGRVRRSSYWVMM